MQDNQSALSGTIKRSIKNRKEIENKENKNMSDKFIDSYDIYRRGRAAMQFKLGLNVRDGAKPGVFIDMTDKPKGDAFDWNGKVTIKLGINDLGMILSGLDKSLDKIEMIHDPGAGSDSKGAITKSITIVKNPKRAGYYFNIVVSENKKMTRKISVLMSDADIAILKSILNVAVCRILRWM